MSPAVKAWVTRHASAEDAYRARVLRSMRTSINDAARRQAKKAKNKARVTVTIDDIKRKLECTGWRCAVTGLAFWSCRTKFGPTMPSLDRIKPDGDYSARNVRVVLYGVNGLRGRANDAIMRRIATAIVTAKERKR